MARSSTSSKRLPSAFELFKPSWEAVKLNLITFIELILIPIMLSLILSLPQWHHKDTVLISEGFAVLVSILLAPAVAYTQLQSALGKKIDFMPAIQNSLKYFWRIIGLAICLGVIVVVGLILFVVPGLFMLRRYILAPYYLIDRDIKVFEAMHASAHDSKEYSYAIWGLISVEFLLVVVSVVPIVGVIASALLGIIYYCAPAVRYTQVKKASKA